MGKLVEIKTKPTSASVDSFINSIPDEQKRKDSFVLLEMMKKATGQEPILWSSSVIGFGNKRYKSPATGREVVLAQDRFLSPQGESVIIHQRRY